MSGPIHRRASLRLRLALLAVAALATLAVAELLLRTAPRLLPAWYRLRFPANGVELLRPGTLDATPLTAVPLPYPVDPYVGPPPHDLVDFGVAARGEAEVDRSEVPRLVLPADADGLPNAVRPAAPDLALVGDSFTVFAAQLEPPGAQVRLAALLDASILNASISGIGPDQELFLLERVVLPARPRLVVWLFFGGNDLIDSLWSVVHRAQGIATYGQLFADRRPPRLYLPDLLLTLCRPAPPAAGAPLPGFALADQPARRLWFHPDALRALSQPRERLGANPGWNNIRAVLGRAQAAAAAAGARLLVVYVPSKEQVYLPRIVPDPGLLQAYVEASVLYGIPVPDDSGELLRDLDQGRGALEAELAAFCAATGLAYWSSTPVLEAFATAGQQAYYACDSHWRAEAQVAVAEALALHLHATGLFGR